MTRQVEPGTQDVPDVVGPGLDVLFCGINPGRTSGSLGQHFARPGNRFWKLLHAAGFTDRVLAPAEQRLLLDYKLGVTNLVDRTTRAGADVGPLELVEGARRLTRKVERWSPAWLAVLGVVAYRQAFGRPGATIGRQPECIDSTGIWVLPNPSGLQARYQLPQMAEMFAELRAAAVRAGVPRSDEFATREPSVDQTQEERGTPCHKT
jgi:TDG/mug DNA glycosylase family protein